MTPEGGDLKLVGDDSLLSSDANAGEYAPSSMVPGTSFTVLRVLGRGGHATVYEVENAIGKHLVVKVVHPHLANRGDFARRIGEEARALVQLEHPNIVAVYDLGLTVEPNPRPFIVMERLSGKNVREILEEVGRLEVKHAVDIGIDVCSALSVAHAKKVVHQDIKPDNIFIHVGLDGRPVTKLVDFGIIRMLDRPQDKDLFEGTLVYAAPEQLRFQGITAQTDLFAVGILLFELMTGVRPFPDVDDAPSPTAAVQRRLGHLSQPAPSLSQWLLVPAELETIVKHCLTIAPGARPESAAKLGDALRTVRRKLETAAKGAQLRTESTLLGAVAEVRGAPARPPGAGAETAALEAPVAPGGRFAQAQEAPARVAAGVLTGAAVAAGQSGRTERIAAEPAAGRGRFADAIAADPRSAERTSVAPPEADPSARTETHASKSEAATLDPTAVPENDRVVLPRTKLWPVLAGGAVVILGAIALWFGTHAPRVRENATATISASSPVAPLVVPAPAEAALPPVAQPPVPQPPPEAAVQPAAPPPPTQAAVTAEPAPIQSQAPSGAPAPAPADAHPSRSTHSSPAPKSHTPTAKDSVADWLEKDAPAPAAKPKPKPDKPKKDDTLESF